MITIDGGTGSVFLGAIPLVPPQINEDFETILGWADDAAPPEGSRERRHARPTPRGRASFGAEGIGLCRTEHMFFGDERLPVVQEMILAEDEVEPPRRARPAAAVPAVRLRGDLRGDGGPAGDDPPARPAAARVPAAARSRRPTSGCARGSARCARRTRCSARAAAASACSARRSTRCRCARSRAPRARCSGGRRRAARRDHAPARRLRGGAAPAARADRARLGGGGARRSRIGRHDDRAAARLRPRGRDRRGTPTSSRSARTT